MFRFFLCTLCVRDWELREGCGVGGVKAQEVISISVETLQEVQTDRQTDGRTLLMEVLSVITRLPISKARLFYPPS